VVIARAEDTSTLDPAAAVTPADIAPVYELYDTLYRLSDDGKTIEPMLATAEPTQSANGKKWTITLRSGVTFSDGTPLTSADVKYSLDRSRNSKGAFAFLLSPISAIATPDAQTVEITTAGGSATLVAGLSSWVAAILPKDLEGKGAQAFFEHPIGSGPFVFDTWNRSQFLRLHKNPTYWQAGQPSLDSVQWTTVPDGNTRVSQVQGGQAQIAGDIPFSQVPTLKSSSGVTAGTFPANYTSMLIFNQKFAPFADEHVRRAIAQAVDKTAIVNSALFGAGSVACSLVPPTMPYASDPGCLPFGVAAAKAELAQSAYPLSLIHISEPTRPY
jgi:peptide/nickel transport system substrate-binding protein